MQTLRSVSMQFRHDRPYDVIASDDLLSRISMDLAGKCSHGMFVEKATKILTQGHWQKLHDTDYTGAQISVKVELRGVILPRGFIIPNCRITAIQNRIIVFENDYSRGICDNIPEIGFLSVGLVVPMIVEKSDHIGSKIAVSGKLFSHNISWHVYKIIDGPEISGELAEYLAAEMARKIASIRSADAAAVEKFFKGVICRGRGSIGTSLMTPPPIGKIIELNESLDGTWVESARPFVDELSREEAIISLCNYLYSYIEIFTTILANCKSEETLRRYTGLLKYIAKSR